MQIKKNLHLTYCTNIHSGETWESVFQNLKKYIPSIKSSLSPHSPFGIGLRLSDVASVEILEKNHLYLFKTWLQENDCYLFTMNGFPFGNFHKQKVKDAVHLPDWTSDERLAYTLRLFDILAEIVPNDIDGGISTSPISYKLWWKSQEEISAMMLKATENILKVVGHLVDIRKKTGKILHLDIEPEPDGILENTEETISYFDNYLLRIGVPMLTKAWAMSASEAREAILTHVQLCYDVCHFAIAYEDHAKALQRFDNHGIKIGKFQISAALKSDLPMEQIQRNAIFEEFELFNEPVYLHQVIAKDKQGKLLNFNDLPLALAEGTGENFVEWRTHFHVPIFLSKYQLLQSTQEDIIKVLKILKDKANISNHLEVETYTWDVLPMSLKEGISESIQRELAWVREQL
jgi:hypothetical protein